VDPETLEARFREGYEALNRGDFESAVTWMREDVTFRSAGPLGTIEGREAVLAFLRPEALVDLRLEIVDVEIRDSVLLVHHIARAKGAESGVPVQQPGWQVWWVDEDGFGYRTEVHDNPADALSAAGWDGAEDA
jgi:hypothetical protein